MLKVGILGLGSIGLRHARNLVALGADVIGFDPDAERRNLLRDAGGTAVAGRAAVLETAEAVVVATPNAAHVADMADALAHGCHVFVEKPIGNQGAAVEKILDQADAAGRIVFVGLNARFNPAVTAARQLLQDGTIGERLWARFIAASYLPSWRTGQDHRAGYAADPRTGGILFDAIHEFDLAWFLLGAATTVGAAAACTGRLGIESDDCADVILRHDDGVQSALHLDYLTRPRRRRFEVAGATGILDVDVAGRSLTVTDSAGKVVVCRTFDSTSDIEYRQEMQAFLNSVTDGGAPACEGREALEVLRAVEHARSLAGLPAA